jgi:hypothetical protein
MGYVIGIGTSKATEGANYVGAYSCYEDRPYYNRQA